MSAASCRRPTRTAKLHSLREIARRYTAELGNPDVRAVVYRTTRQRAELAVGPSLVNSDQPAYLIVLYGDANVTIRNPVGRPLDVDGRIAAITVDAERVEPTDAGVPVEARSVDVHGLGRPIALDVTRGG